MGLGYCPGTACIASSYRLKKGNKLTQFYKVAIHELGHTQGLPHCSTKTCLMRDAEGGNPIDEENDFCPKCKKVLIAAGWALN
jgi:archaemetzincin